MKSPEQFLIGPSVWGAVTGTYLAWPEIPAVVRMPPPKAISGIALVQNLCSAPTSPRDQQGARRLGDARERFRFQDSSSEWCTDLSLLVWL
ncbi:hypothetical protein ACWEO2_27880 [Nocardia sp. NPDC004278]